MGGVIGELVDVLIEGLIDRLLEELIDILLEGLVGGILKGLVVEVVEGLVVEVVEGLVVGLVAGEGELDVLSVDVTGVFVELLFTKVLIFSLALSFNFFDSISSAVNETGQESESSLGSPNKNLSQ